MTRNPLILRKADDIGNGDGWGGATHTKVAAPAVPERVALRQTLSFGPADGGVGGKLALYLLSISVCEESLPGAGEGRPSSVLLLLLAISFEQSLTSVFRAVPRHFLQSKTSFFVVKATDGMPAKNLGLPRPLSFRRFFFFFFVCHRVLQEKCGAALASERVAIVEGDGEEMGGSCWCIGQSQ